MMGRPDPLRFIELGPGRGTLMSDALRAARIAPDFRTALDVTLVEASPSLAEIQHDTCDVGRAISWASALAMFPRAGHRHRHDSRRAADPPYVRSHNRWRERVVGWRRTAARLRAGASLSVHPGAGRGGDSSRCARRASADVFARRGWRARRRRAVPRLRPRRHLDRRHLQACAAIASSMC